jgi:nucleotide-binding universal stress UspA family protein
MSTKQSIILVPTDFSQVAECAAMHAATIAQKSGEEVCLFHVIDKSSKSDLKKKNEDEQYLETKLQRLSELIANRYQITCTYKLKDGHIFNTIGEMASECGASLIVIGTHGVQGIQHLVGAYALKVVASSKVPVIIVQNKLPNDAGYAKIVSPIDGSVETKQKTMQTISVAKILNAKVYLFKQKGYDAHLDDRITLNLNFVKKHLTIHHVSFEVVEQQAYTKNFAKEFIQYAQSIESDLIIILTTNEKGLKDMIIGPEEQNVINNEEGIPVMCVNPLQNLYITERLASAVNLSF